MKSIGLPNAVKAIVGAVLQTASVHVAMMIVGRLLAGIGCGSLLSVVPVYLAEASQPDSRGFLVGLHGMMIAIGFGVANWVGYGGSYASSHAQWRIPLAMQIPIPILMMVGCIYIPFSPRWRRFTFLQNIPILFLVLTIDAVAQQDRIEEAEKGVCYFQLSYSRTLILNLPQSFTNSTASKTRVLLVRN